MDIKITKQDDSVVLNISGRVDTTTAKDFEAVAKEVLAGECSNIILDCAELSYVSSSGLRVFLILQKGVIAKKGKLTLTGMIEPIKEVFRITGFSKIFNIE